MGDNELVNIPVKPTKHLPENKLAKTIRNQELVLTAYAECGNLSEAARIAKVPIPTAYDWLRLDAEFKEQYQVADRVYGDSVRSIIRKRIEDPTGNRGSDALVMFEAKGRFPEVYRETPPPITDESAKQALEAMTRAVVQFNLTNIVINQADSGP